MLKTIDNFLNRITMYRLVMYSLMILLLQAAVLGEVGVLRFSALQIILSSLVLLAVCWLANIILAKLFKAHPNVESVYITALILALIINPAQTSQQYWFLAWAGILAMASKYILAIGKKHIFNPAAIAVIITGYALGQYASWWVGTSWMLPLVLIIGFLVVRKVRSWDMVFTFIATAFFLTTTIAFFQHKDVINFAKQLVFDSPLFFLSTIMLTEPLTAPSTKRLQIWYGMLVGVLFVPQLNIVGFYLTPEMALCTGNVFAYIVSPKERLLLTLKEKIQLSPDIYNFVFSADKAMKFKAGQYLEWTLNLPKPDGRGNRRYFTIASSPTEKDLIVGVKFYQPASAFKKSLLAMRPGEKIMAGQLAGDFTLPKDSRQKLAFIAGGIGVTPFRSMLKYLSDRREKRDIKVFFANKSPQDIVYEEIFEEAKAKLGVETTYTVSDIQTGWGGKVGYIDANMIKSKIPDYNERMFYISGPRSMIDSFKKTLNDLGINSSHIKTDFFPGFV